LKLLLATTESRNARAKLKIQGYPAGTIQPRGKFFASFLLVQERWSLKPKGFSETKENSLDSRFHGNDGRRRYTLHSEICRTGITEKKIASLPTPFQ
jgi:hypothetical protein